MTLKSMTAKKLFILGFVCMLFLAARTTYAQQSPFERLKQKFEEGQVFRADFTHTYVDSYTKESSKSSGEIWVGENQYKIDSPEQRMAVNGEVSRVYDTNRNRLIVSTYVPEEDDFAPSRILNGVDSTYSIEQQLIDNGRHLIILQSDDPFALFKKVEITLSSNLIPQNIFVRDPADNRLITTFSEGSFIERQQDVFTLEYPANAEIIDMRN